MGFTHLSLMVGHGAPQAHHQLGLRLQTQRQGLHVANEPTNKPDSAARNAQGQGNANSKPKLEPIAHAIHI
jgi:hypothetical protein